MRISKIIGLFAGAARSFIFGGLFSGGLLFWRTSRTDIQKIIKRWLKNGQKMVKAGQKMVTSRSKGGQKVVKRWSKHGQNMVKTWSKDGDKMVKR